MPADGDASWFLYLLECEGNTIYTGITTDVERRFAQHLAGTGAKYTRSRKPIRILGWQRFANRSEASKAEAAAKRLTSAQKRALCVNLTRDLKRPQGEGPAGT
ncbi:GIY-YIG nuclease family protein [Cupriavidus basilensis]|uniref:GIY-YIG nuclease family protein n=1 Tax=Cupriavidus basilensis TaxID=68895 RepID=A0ABT6AH19_9BURK|nr:GIY-YIG nuclease family protein [Cupriavidus basilensis]MDF3831893.1 GIY-YIG nuclease family protein [Cupriavidus basilensis]